MDSLVPALDIKFGNVTDGYFHPASGQVPKNVLLNRGIYSNSTAASLQKGKITGHPGKRGMVMYCKSTGCVDVDADLSDPTWQCLL